MNSKIKKNIGPILIILLLVIMISYHEINKIKKPTKKQDTIGENMKDYSNEFLNLINIHKNYDQLLEITYLRGGGIENTIDKRTLDVKNLTYRIENGEVRTYKVNQSQLSELKEMIDIYNFPMWKDAPRSDIQALDAEGISITFAYNNQEIGGPEVEWYTISNDQLIPNDARKKLEEFENKLFALDQVENRIG